MTEQEAALVNMLRAQMVLSSRHFKDLFARAVVPQRWLYRWLFRGENGELRRVGEHVLRDLRDFCGADRTTIFDPDIAVMARREGRREVFVRISNFLNLDEQQVQQLMEIDDGGA